MSSYDEKHPDLLLDLSHSKLRRHCHNDAIVETEDLRSQVLDLRPAAAKFFTRTQSYGRETKRCISDYESILSDVTEQLGHLKDLSSTRKRWTERGAVVPKRTKYLALPQQNKRTPSSYANFAPSPCPFRPLKKVLLDIDYDQSIRLPSYEHSLYEHTPTLSQTALQPPFGRLNNAQTIINEHLYQNPTWEIGDPENKHQDNLLLDPNFESMAFWENVVLETNAKSYDFDVSWDDLSPEIVFDDPTNNLSQETLVNSSLLLRMSKRQIKCEAAFSNLMLIEPRKPLCFQLTHLRVSEGRNPRMTMNPATMDTMPIKQPQNLSSVGTLEIEAHSGTWILMTVPPAIDVRSRGSNDYHANFAGSMFFNKLVYLLQIFKQRTRVKVLAQCGCYLIIVIITAKIYRFYAQEVPFPISGRWRRGLLRAGYFYENSAQ